MPTEIEVWVRGDRRIVSLEGDRWTIGKDASNDLVLDDSTVSRLHALLERYSAGWCVTDLGSANGTFVNGERLWSTHRLRNGDEIKVGPARLGFRNAADQGRTATETTGATPSLTARERDVLCALCRPLLARDLFTEPASVREIAEELVVSEAAVKQHLTNLFGKFGVIETSHRRARLANEALRSGAVSLSDLRGTPD